jgi:hypothetical protein
MGDAPVSEMEWNESFFRDCFDNVVNVVTWISRKGKPFSRHQMRSYLVDRGLDPLKQEKQARSDTCRTSRANSHQLEVGTTSGDV